MFANKVILNINMLGMRVIDRVLSKSNIALVLRDALDMDNFYFLTL